MTGTAKQRIIAIEEHYADAEVMQRAGSGHLPAIVERSKDITGARLKEMDAAGVDMQILSHLNPCLHQIDAELAVELAAPLNDRLAAIVTENPDRFAAFASLPTPDPRAAADELERCVATHGFKGAIINGLTNNRFIDEKDFWPIFERAAALDTPIYMHPGRPHPQLIDTYLKDYAKDFPAFLTAGWGFTAETATAVIRMVLSGVFDTYPNLKIVVGHLGEGLPFLLWRTNYSIFGKAKNPRYFTDVFTSRVWVTTSGNFSTPALQCCISELGADRVMFAVDWPFVPNGEGVGWLKDAPIAPDDKAKIFAGNAERLFGL